MSNVSIVTVTRNHADGLAATLESIASQEGPRPETIVVDGHSTDTTPEVLKRHAHMVDRVEKDRGIGIYSAMNQGVALATRQWILFLNAGDRLFSSSVLRNFVPPKDTELAYGRAWRIGEKHPIEYKPFEKMWRGSVLCHQALFTRADFIRAQPLPTCYLIAGDYAFYARAKSEGRRFAVLDLDVARVERGGLSDIRPILRTWERYSICRKYFPNEPIHRYYWKEIWKRTKQKYLKRRKG